MSKTQSVTLLNDDGSASMATMFMMSHHAFRRDIALFASALRGQAPSLAPLKEEWTRFCEKLHGHHQAEDNGIFPSLKAEQPAMAPIIDRLGADHRRIDPLLEAGTRAFADLPASLDAASAVVGGLSALLDDHLALEEAEVIPFIRAAKVFPTPATEAEAELYAQGFAWALHGIAPEVVDRAYVMLPEVLTSRLSAARGAFARHCEEVWGAAGFRRMSGASRTPIPDWFTH
jgi:hypothetical protein